MSDRSTHIFSVAVLLALGAALVSPVQSSWAQAPGAEGLGSAEASALDARFERIVQKAAADRLTDAIAELPAPNPRPASSQRTAIEGGRLEGAGVIQSKARPTASPVQGPPRYSVLDVRPDARTSSGTPVYEAIVYADEALPEGAGVSVTASFEGFSTVRATPTGLRTLAGSEGVSRILSPRRAQPHNDPGAAEVGARSLNNGAVGGTAYTGEGTLSCVIDSGIDWSHPDFTDENGNTRIHAIWDQVDDSTFVASPSDNDASRFGPNFNPSYGAEYLQSDVQAAIDGGSALNKKDFDGHGTHVTGSLASSGEAYEQSSGTERYQGAAPETDIITVKAGEGSYSTFNILNGISYCQALAEDADRPLVINMSLGTDFAPHDGSSPLASVVSQITDDGAASGTVVVTSAGNSGSPFGPIHTQADLTAGGSADVGIEVTDYTPNDDRFNDFFAVNLWTYAPGPYEVSVFSPNKQDTVSVTVDGSLGTRDTSVTTPRGQVFVESSTVGNGRYFSVESFDNDASAPPASGEWTVRFRQNGDQSTPIHGWFGGAQLGDGDTAGSASFADADNRYTIGSPGTSTGTITVGNYIHRTRWTTNAGSSLGFGPSSGFVRDQISPSSSRGPTVDGRTKPDIAAPGTFTASALSDDTGPSFGANYLVGDGEHHLLLGTSMSAPLTAGSVALLLQADASLTTNEVRDLLKNTARVDAAVEERGVPNQTFGAGKLNVQNALSSLQGTEAPLEILSYEEASGSDQQSVVTLGGSGAERVSLRFTPTMRGRAAGVYLSLFSNQSSTAANRLSDSLQVEIWSDEGGTPGTQLGRQVSVPASALTAYTPNVIDLSAANVSVASGEDYHVVLSPSNDGDEVDLLAETAGPTSGRSATFDGSTWSGTGNDLVLRTQIRADVTPPPPVAGVNLNTAEPQNVAISWDAVSAVDLAEYYVYRDTSPIASATDRTPFDTVATDVTSYTDTEAPEGQTYYYRIASVDRSGNVSALSPSTSAFLYPSDVQAEVSQSFGDGGADSDDYRLVALPGQADRDVAEVFSGESGVGWSVLWDNGSDSDFLVEYDGSEAFNFRPGRGFWAVSTSDLTVSESISTIPQSDLQDGTAATIPLHDGWNIVSNPFGKDVAWAVIDAANEGDLQPIFGFDGSFTEQDVMASSRTGEAFYFLNDQELDQLTIPYPGAPRSSSSASEAALATAKTSSPALSLDATLAGPRASDANSTVRVHSAADVQNDSRTVAPPQRFEAVSLTIPTDDADDARRGRLTGVTRSFDQGQTIPLVLQTQKRSSVRLRVSGSALEEQSVALLHPEEGRRYTLTGAEGTTIPVGEEHVRLTLAVGSDAYVDRQAEDVLPKKTTLTSAPNPVREQASIRYTLPEGASVRLDVYDILGRHVTTLVDGRKEAGRHHVPFSASTLSSGVYFGRLKVGDRVLNQKITVVR